MAPYGRSNNVVLSSIPENVPDNNLESTVISVLSDIDVEVESRDIEWCHRMGKPTSETQKTIVRFMNRDLLTTLAIQIFCLGKKMLMQNRFFSIFDSKMVICLGKMVTCLGKIIYYFDLYYFLLSHNKLQWQIKLMA